jgi:DNA-binding MarR family transcriptional regulator
MGRANPTPTTIPGRLLALHDTVVEAAPGITSGELRAFFYVADNEGTRQCDVRDHLDIPQATVSRALSNLQSEALNLVECTPKGRHHELRMSHKGRQLLAALAVLMGCCIIAPASDGILSQFEIKPSQEVGAHAHAPGYEVCLDPTVFSCDVS